MSSVIKKVAADFNIDNKKLNSFFNPYSYFVVRSGFDEIDSWLIDGQMAVILMRILGFRVKRRSFDMTSLAPDFFEFCEKRGKSLAIVGSSPENIKSFVNFILVKYPNLKINYFRNGFFNSISDMNSSFQDLVDLNPDFVICGMGAGKQEEFLIMLREFGWCGTGYTCGGFIHQTASSGLAYYPKWADRFNLRWLYRMIDEPKLVVRYLKYYPIFPFVLFYDFFRERRR